MLLFADDLFLEHRTGAHPERPERLTAIRRQLEGDGLWSRCTHLVAVPASREALTRVHAPAHIDDIVQFAGAGGGQIEVDTIVSPRSADAALLAAGAVVTAVDRVLAGPDRRALCLVRPPGHHARPHAPMGFCLFNNIAVGAAHAIGAHGLSRVLIVDWDVHHGNGTQEMFWQRDDVFFFSSHRFPFYPGSGSAGETGTGAGLGATLNLPLAFGTPRAEILDRFRSALARAAAASRPELVLVSAGFDAHRRDPIGSLGLETEDFAELTAEVLQVAEDVAGGRIVSVLEGGYDLDALGTSVAAHTAVLLEGTAA